LIQQYSVLSIELRSIGFVVEKGLESRFFTADERNAEKKESQYESEDSKENKTTNKIGIES